MPSINLPEKSLSPSPTTPRQELVRQVTPVPVLYENLEHFEKRILPLKMAGWSITKNEDSVVF